MESSPVWDRQSLRAPHEVGDKARRVRAMFDAIAPRYELVNSIFSGGLDSRWRKRAVKLARVQPGERVLDVACGTGDLARAFQRWSSVSAIGCDFSHEMLLRAKNSTADNAPLVESDALKLPFKNESFSIISCAFGVRNFADLDAGLREMKRVLTPKGRAVILEFTQPRVPLLRTMYEFYSNRIMPVAASIVSRDRTGAYHYLPRSVASFIDAGQMANHLKNAGFSSTSIHPLTFGVVTVYVAFCH